MAAKLTAIVWRRLAAGGTGYTCSSGGTGRSVVLHSVLGALSCRVAVCVCVCVCVCVTMVPIAENELRAEERLLGMNELVLHM